MKSTSGYSFINHKALQDFQAIHVKEFSFKSHRYCFGSGFGKERRGIRLKYGAGGSGSSETSNNDMTAHDMTALGGS